MRRYVIPRIACINLASEFQLLAGSPGDGDNEDFKPGGSGGNKDGGCCNSGCAKEGLIDDYDN